MYVPLLPFQSSDKKTEKKVVCRTNDEAHLFYLIVECNGVGYIIHLEYVHTPIIQYV